MKMTLQKFQNTTLLFAVIILTALQSQAQGTWTALTNLAPHSNGGGMLLLSDGTVLCKSFGGGADGYGNIYDKLTPNASGSYVNGTWSSIAPMVNTRLYYSSQILKDGRVYVAGGEYGTGNGKGETYNPLTNIWTLTPNPGTVSDANSEILEDGRVLQALVTGNLKTNVIWNPTTNTYSAGPSCNGIHNESSWVKLPDNSIIMVDRNATTSERYIPSLNTWVTDATVPVALYDPYGLETGAALLLPNGQAFFIGSTGNTAFYTPSGNNTNGTWTAGPAVPGGKGAPDAPAAMMVNGKVLLAVSPAPTSANHFPTPTSYYTFDYLTNTYTQINAPGGGLTVNQSCYVANMLQLPDGKVLYADQDANQYYVFNPPGAILAAGKPVISNIAQTSCTQYRITGTQFNGISQGANYGDDWQMSTNYPVIRLKSGSNVYYARSFNWNSTGVQRGTTADTAFFTLPAGLPAGTYSLVVTANGIASDSVLFNTTPTVSFSGLSPNYQVSAPAVTLTGTPAGGTFSGPGISGNIFTPANAGVGGPYTITYTFCTYPSSQQVTVSNCAAPATPTAINLSGGNAKVCPGETRTYTTPTVSGVNYIWDAPAGTTINSGQGTNTIQLTYQSSFVSGDTLSVIESNACGNSLPRNLKIYKNFPAATNTPTGPTTFCYGTAPLTLSANSGTGLTYQWKKGATNILGATGQTYIPTVTATSYKVIVTNTAGCSKTSPGVAVTVNALPAATITPQGPTTFCVGGSVVLLANSGTGLTYQWKKAGSLIGGATLQNYTATTAGTYRVIVTNASGCTKTSAGLVVTVNCKSGETAITENEHFNLSLFPNPATDEITVSFDSEQSTVRLKILNVIGEVILNENISSEDGSYQKQLDVSNLPAGIYTLLISSDNETAFKKFVKQ